MLSLIRVFRDIAKIHAFSFHFPRLLSEIKNAEEVILIFKNNTLHNS